MNKNRKEYSPPCVEMLEARVEKGFGTSGSGTPFMSGDDSPSLPTLGDV